MQRIGWVFLALALGGGWAREGTAGEASNEKVFADLSSPTPPWAGWKAEGPVFGGAAPARKLELNWREYLSVRADTSGMLTSPEFKAEFPYVNLRLREGVTTLHGQALLVLKDTSTLRRDGIIRRSPHPGLLAPPWITWDVRDYQGATLSISLVDIADQKQVNLDRVVFSRQPLGDLSGKPEIAAAARSVERERGRAAEDPQRPIYHTAAPAGKTWDVNGCVYWNGWYHLCYLTIPPGLPAFQLHLRSRDLVNWEQLPPVAWPSAAIGETDVYSGDMAVDESGRGLLVYTSVGVDRTPMFTAMQVLQTTTDPDFVSWQKNYEAVVAMGDVPLESRHVRDPFLFRQGKAWYMALTGQVLRDRYRRTFANAPHWVAEATKGCVFIFTSTDGQAWRYVGCPLAADQVNVWNTPLWEMAMVIPFGDRWLFTNGGKAFFTGPGDPAANFKVTAEGSITQGTLYACRRVFAPDGRCLIWGNVDCGWGLKDGKPARGLKGWEGAHSLPRVWALDGSGRLLQSVAHEIEGLRGAHFAARNMKLGDGPPAALEFSGNTIEISARLELGTAKHCGLELRRSHDGSRGMRFDYDGRCLTVSSIGPELVPVSEVWWAQPIHVASEPNPEKAVELRIFLDRGLLELFVDNRVSYERPIDHIPLDDVGIAAFSQGGEARLARFDAWTMQPVKVTFGAKWAAVVD